MLRVAHNRVPDHGPVWMQAQQRAKPLPAKAFPQYEGSTLVDVIEQMTSFGLNGEHDAGNTSAPEANGDHTEPYGGADFLSGRPNFAVPVELCK